MPLIVTVRAWKQVIWLVLYKAEIACFRRSDIKSGQFLWFISRVLCCWSPSCGSRHNAVRNSRWWSWTWNPKISKNRKYMRVWELEHVEIRSRRLYWARAVVQVVVIVSSQIPKIVDRGILESLLSEVLDVGFDLSDLAFGVWDPLAIKNQQKLPKNQKYKNFQILKRMLNFTRSSRSSDPHQAPL